MYTLIIAAAAMLLSWALTALVLRALLHARRFAEPTERGMHQRAVPVGGGVAIMAALAVLWPLTTWPLARADQIALGCAIGLSLISWIDDRHPLWPLTRLVVQALAVAIALTTLPDAFRFAPAMPFWLERIALAAAWVWMINLFNFMDGIDGLAAAETITVGLGVVALAMFTSQTGSFVPLAALLAGAAAGYLIWNWHPARIFMGDAGSIPIGFLSGWLLLALVQRGYWAAALILPLYFLVDATWTLLKRVVRGETPWHPHREHAYQQAVLGGLSHDAVVYRVFTANVLLVGLSLVSVRYPWPAIALASVVVLALINILTSVDARGAQSTRSTSDDTPAEQLPSHEPR
jgi:UDP-N-acetylmuramyl pentapeptide phosphotransferase/UDP-N-acetylglucosamine-1-phosphate transferase